MERLTLLRLLTAALPLIFAMPSLADAPPLDPSSDRRDGHLSIQPGQGALRLPRAQSGGPVICYYRSRAGNCFRLLRVDWSHHFGPITAAISSEARFRQFASELQLYADEIEFCEISERWSPWTAILKPSGEQIEQRFCSPGPVSDAPACPCQTVRQTRPISSKLALRERGG